MEKEKEGVEGRDPEERDDEEGRGGGKERGRKEGEGKGMEKGKGRVLEQVSCCYLKKNNI